MNNFELAVNRIRNINWEHKAKSDISLLFKEYMRRARIWKDYFGVEPRIIFFDPLKYIDDEYDVDEEFEVIIEDVVANLKGYNITLCASYLRFSAFKDMSDSLPDLPDLFEPIVKLMEESGSLITLNGFAEIEGRSFYLKDWDSFNASESYIDL